MYEYENVSQTNLPYRVTRFLSIFVFVAGRFVRATIPDKFSGITCLFRARFWIPSLPDVLADRILPSIIRKVTSKRTHRPPIHNVTIPHKSAAAAAPHQPLPDSFIMEDIFHWCREGNAIQVRLWLDDTEHDMNLG